MANKLTDRTLFAGSLTTGAVIHIVDVTDTSQNPAGSSYKLTLAQLASYFGIKTRYVEPYTIAGSTQTIVTMPTFVYGYYLNGQKINIGGRIVSVISNVITFDQDYTGSFFEMVAEH